MREDPAHPLRRTGAVWSVASALLEGGGLRHWFLCRAEGESAGAYRSLNLRFDAGDDPAIVARNRERVRVDLGLPRPPLLVRQVHGTAVAVVEAGGEDAFAAAPPAADAILTRARGVPLALLTADCLPVVIWDRRTPALGLVHAGWRGTVRSAVFKAVFTMMETFGTQPEDCLAAIGPGIAPSCYEVGEDVREAFVKGLPYGQDVLKPGRELHWWADLKEANRRQLLDARIPAAQVDLVPVCTHCEAEWFFSARRDGGASGRQATVACLA